MSCPSSSFNSLVPFPMAGRQASPPSCRRGSKGCIGGSQWESGSFYLTLHCLDTACQVAFEVFHSLLDHNCSLLIKLEGLKSLIDPWPPSSLCRGGHMWVVLACLPGLTRFIQFLMVAFNELPQQFVQQSCPISHGRQTSPQSRPRGSKGCVGGSQWSRRLDWIKSTGRSSCQVALEAFKLLIALVESHCFI